MDKSRAAETFLRKLIYLPHLKDSGFIVYFNDLAHLFFLKFGNCERNYGFNSVHAFVVIAIFLVYRKLIVLTT